jgi:autoinducer 2 (AI-2) kinase
MENAALVTKGHMDLVREAGGGMPEEIIFASGASKSPLWCQIVADVMGLPVKVPVVKEATALGAAILAGYGVGVYGSIEEAVDSLVKWEKTYQPNCENHETYSKMYTVWREFYLGQLNLSDRRVTRYMWAALGL